MIININFPDYVQLSAEVASPEVAVIPAWSHVRHSCLTPVGSMQIRSRRICAGIQSTRM
jgi:hypothetical protein